MVEKVGKTFVRSNVEEDGTQVVYYGIDKSNKQEVKISVVARS